MAYRVRPAATRPAHSPAWAGRLRARLERPDARRGLWAFADQGTVSLGSFLTGIIVARTLAPELYGVYALTLGVVLLFVTFDNALVTSRLSIDGAELDPRGLSRLAGACVLLTLVVALAGGIALLGATRALDRSDVAPWAAVALACWLIQETVRRALMAHLHYGKAVVGDVLSYLGQAGLVWTLAQRGQLTLESVFLAIALTSSVAALVQSAQVGIQLPSMGEVRAMALRSWRLGRWLLLGDIAGMVTIQGLPWILAFTRGAAAAAALQAAVNVMGVSHPIMFAVANLIVPGAAHSRRQGGVRSASRTAFTYATFGAALLVPYYVVVLARPTEVLEVFYGAGSPYAAIVDVLRVYVLVYAFTYAAIILTGLLTALERSRQVFYTQVANAMSALVFGSPLIAILGVTGAAFGALAASVTYAVACVVLLRRRGHTRETVGLE